MTRIDLAIGISIISARWLGDLAFFREAEPPERRPR